VVWLVNRTTESCLAAPDVPEDKERLTISSDIKCMTSSERRFQWRMRRIAEGYMIFETVLPRSDGKRVCLDGTLATHNEAKVHVYGCSDDDSYQSQKWKIRLAQDGYVRLVKKDTEFCLDSTGTREREPHPHLWECKPGEHNQYWQIIFRDET
jgi:hypothetical protein